MKYRAKVTWIEQEVREYYKDTKLYFARDTCDVYAEVDTSEEADCLERMNKAEYEKTKAELELLQLILS